MIHGSYAKAVIAKPSTPVYKPMGGCTLGVDGLAIIYSVMAESKCGDAITLYMIAKPSTPVYKPMGGSP